MCTRFLRATLALISLLLIFTATTLLVYGQGQRETLLKESTIVFSGTVEKVNAASFSGVPVSSHTIVVKVDAVVSKPPAIPLASGDKVTVETAEGTDFKPGNRATFYSNGWIFGDGLAVREVGHEESPGGKTIATAAQPEVKALQQQKRNADLQAQIQQADVIVTGKVVNIFKEAAASPETTFISEHNPDWQNAVVQVSSVLKGLQPEQKQVVVRFPASLDVMWVDFPRFKLGEEGTLLLKTDNISGIPKASIAGAPVNAYIAVSRKQVLSMQDASAVRNLMK